VKAAGGKIALGEGPASPGPRWLTNFLRYFLGIAEKFFAGGQAAAAFTDVFDVFELPLAIMLFMGSMFKTAVVTCHRRALRIAQVPGFFGQGSAGGANIGLLFHKPLLIYTLKCANLFIIK
jgi:hypothetical protein